MKRAICFVLSMLAINALAEVVIDEALLVSTISQGTNIFYTCIVVPPVTPHQNALCASLYSGYITSLTTLNEPYPLILSVDPDPYAWSTYDVCRYETEHTIFGNQGVQPYCPTV